MCCADSVHCCPEEYMCDMNSGQCLDKSPSSLPLLPFSSNPFNITPLCPNSQVCPANNTCCFTSVFKNTYGCCDFLNGVCCDDYVHCCPAKHECDLGQCVNASVSPHPLLRLSSHPERNIKEFPVPKELCSGGHEECPTGNTCCVKNSTAQSFGCCPRANAVCCAHTPHCCPEGYACNVSSGQCLKNVPSSLPLLSFASHAKRMNIAICPNDEKCPVNNTCCFTDGIHNTYGCCDELNGVCCGDYVHCCPHGYKCDLSKGQCVNAQGSSHRLLLQLVNNVSVSEKAARNVMKEKLPGNVQN